MDWRQYIEQRPDVMLGKPITKDTHLTGEIILERLSDGDSEAELLDSYPQLRPEYIRAARGAARKRQERS